MNGPCRSSKMVACWLLCLAIAAFVGISHGFSYAASFDQERDRRRLLEYSVRNANEARWDDLYEELVVYHQREGHSNVPQKHKENGQPLGRWLSTQRQAKKKGTLDAKKVQRLEALEVPWSLAGAKWESMYSLLYSYQETEGHCNVPRTHETECGYNLGRWLDSQRTARNNGRLDIRYQRRLEALGVVWSLNDVKWEELFAVLEEYKAQHGDCKVPRNYRTSSGHNLGTWLMTQCIAQRTGKMNPEHQQRLEGLGVVWSRPNARKWENMHALLSQYKSREGHCRVPQKHKEDGHNLGAWLNAQRQLKKKGKLDPSREHRLEEIGVVWSIHRS